MIDLPDEAATATFGMALAPLLRAGDVVTLSGPLGAGKTALARSILRALGHAGDVPSPSFAIVQPYDDLQPPVWHADLYRLTDPDELIELGLEEDGRVLLIEWPDRAGRDPWPEALALTLEGGEGTRRRLTARVPAAWEERWPPQ